MRFVGTKRRRLSAYHLLIACVFFTVVGLLLLTRRSIDPHADVNFSAETVGRLAEEARAITTAKTETPRAKECATVEEMGEAFSGEAWEESLRVRRIIKKHFDVNGASRVRSLPPEQFCRHGFVLGKASEAGFGNEMYKILTAAALSVMLNRSLIIGQTRGKYPFEDYISYSNATITLKEVKHLWRQNGCVTKYGRNLVIRTDDFQKPSHTNILCSNWREWEQPIVWLQNTTDAVAAQFFLKNVHEGMRNAASYLFGQPKDLEHRANVFGELMRALISPSEHVSEAVNWVIGKGTDPDIALHMRMLVNRSRRAIQAALSCIRTAMKKSQSRRKVVVVSDTPSLVRDITPEINEFAEVLHFDYKLFRGNISGKDGPGNLGSRVRDWGPAPRWVAFVDFFLASRAKHAVVSGAHRRVGTTYAQLIAALAAANALDDYSSTGQDFHFFSSFQNNLLTEGLKNQVGWGHAWNRFSGPLSCHNQSNQCAVTPLLPLAWWDGIWQSPLPRDIQRMEAYGVKLSGFGTFDEDQLLSSCKTRKNRVVTIPVLRVG